MTYAKKQRQKTKHLNNYANRDRQTHTIIHAHTKHNQKDIHMQTNTHFITDIGTHTTFPL